MKIKRVRIIKSESQYHWYADKIGQEYHVKFKVEPWYMKSIIPENSSYQVIDRCGFPHDFVGKSIIATDAEVIEELEIFEREHPLILI